MGNLGNRIAQKGLECIVNGCRELRRSKGLCMKHGMAMRRYGNVMGGKIDRIGKCNGCGKEFNIIMSNQKYCSNICYKKSPNGRKTAYEATKAYRLRKKERVKAICNKHNH